MTSIAGLLLLYLIACFGTYSLNTESDDCSVCGKGPADFPPLPMVAGGKQIPNTESFPWLVKIEDSYKDVHCGGSILDEYFILTAAHCIKHIRDGELSDGHGQIFIFFQTESKERYSEAGDIETMVVHPRYRLIQSNTSGVLFAKYDIGLIKLKKKIKCNKYKRSICLPKADYKVPSGKTMYIAGWGDQPHLKKCSLGLLSKRKLHYGTLKRVPFKRCSQRTQETGPLKGHMLCLGDTDETMCGGDSGSPLIDKVNGKYTALGVSSSESKSLCDRSAPVMYTNVAKFVNWIEETKRKLLKQTSCL